MVRWLYLLAGPLLWALHFGIVYAIASISLQADGIVTPASRIAIVSASVAIAALIGLITFWPRRQRSTFLDTVRVSAAVISIVGIIWQTLPVILR